MAFAESFLDDIRARVPVSEVVGKRVRLKRKGHGEHLGLCPFHEEKTPSFTVNDAKSFYHCFGCGAHGSAFDFIMNTDGLEFPEAVERLAGQAGLEMPASTYDPLESKRRNERERLLSLLQIASEWFEDKLAARHGSAAWKYVEERGIHRKTAAHFRLGYSPDSRIMLKEAMLARNFSEAELLAVGLLVRPEDGRQLYDRFRNRLMFPITDRRGRVVAFGGRSLGDAQPKYLNSPETDLFHKGALLYNLAGARAARQAAGTVIVAEGYTDVISLWQHGFANAVAPLGTAITDLQVAELWRITPEPILCLDGDAAGVRAGTRTAENVLPLLKPGHSLRFALLPNGDDPDSLLRARGADALTEVLESALPLSEVLWRSMTMGDYSTPERRAGLRQAVFQVVDTIGDRTVQDYYRNHLIGLLEQSFGGRSAGRHGVLRRSAAVSGSRGGPVRRWPERKLTAADGLGSGLAGSARHRERVLVATLLNHPTILTDVLETAAMVRFQTPELDKLCLRIIEIAGKGDILDRDTLRSHFNQANDTAVVDSLIGPGSGLVEQFVRPDASQEEALAGWHDTLALHRRGDLDAERDQAVRRLAEEGTEAAFQQLKALTEEAERERLEELGAGEGLATS